MAIQVIHLRDYEISISSDFVASIVVYNDWSKTSYAALPTIAEIRKELGETVSEIDLTYCFSGCESLTTAPAIPNGVTNMLGCFRGCINLTTAPTIPNTVTNMYYCFYQCKSLTTAPAIPNGVTNMRDCFRGCINLTTAPTIPNTVTDMRGCFQQCKSLTTASTIPSSVTAMTYCFNSCSALTGKVTINANPSTYTSCMAGTQKEIVLVGSSTQLQNIANTATNNNVYVWSLSINLSAERQEDDFSKANVSVIINRFRNNNESVSLTFTMNGVESTPVQVTMDTATKTYTGVLSITPSSIVELSVIAEDSYGKSAPKSITIPIPFYTIDFQAGGKEVAVGSPANDDTSNRPYGLFKCGMDLVVTRLVGEIKMWAGDTVPYGWLLCDGSEVSKTDYPYLYASIGDLWGTPNSSSNFKLPNLAGKVPVGYDSADTDFNPVGHTDGEKKHKLTIAEMPSHSHSRNYYSSNWCANGSKSGYHGNDAGTKRVTGSTGGGQAHNNLQPYAVVKYIICAF